MTDTSEERKKSASTISDAEIIDPMESELNDDESIASTGSRRSSVSTKSKEKTWEEPQEDVEPLPFGSDILNLEPPPFGTDALNVEPKPLSQAEYDAIYTPETRAKAFVMLIYFSLLLIVIPFGSMYICYYHVFNEYDSATDMLYSGIVAIVEVYLIVALFIFFAYKDEQSIEKRVNDTCKKEE
ncbi:hypothetical protein FO519_002216 [Halicephalobus sp. NKZ332]|nr:hypothetical protein FO519_002216 [Halicephalobus sp. NKZ332]